MSTGKKVLIGVGGLVVVAAFVIVSSRSRSDRGAEVRIEAIGRQDLVSAVTASGRIEPLRKVDVSADITGRITRITVREGQWAERGQLLIQIDPAQYEAAVQRAEALLASQEAAAVQAKANRDQASRTHQRAQQLRAQDSILISDEQLEQARTQFEVAEALYLSATHQVEQARAALRDARDALAKTRILAPMSGTVTRLAVEEGEVAVPGTFSRETGLLLTISDLTVIQTVVQVDETDVVRIEVGDSVSVTIDAFPDTTFVGRVMQISQSAIQGAVTGQASGDRAVDFEVEITLDRPPEGIRPDLSATARIVTDVRDSALALPIIALTVRPHEDLPSELQPGDTTSATNATGAADGAKPKEREGVFIVSNGTATFRPVRVGIAGDEHFEVLEGLAEGDSIVAGPYQAVRDLRDKAPVRPAREGNRNQGSGT